MRTALILIPALLTLPACATSPEQMAARDASEAERVPAAEPIGQSVSCIQTRSIRQSKVRNDSVIDFVMNGKQVYRNVLPQSCSGLGFEERFAYKTSIGQLCSVDIITVLRTGGINGPSCGLGEFQPVKLAAANN